MDEAKIKVDIARNRLSVTIAGKLTKQSIDQLYTEVRFGVADLQPGFVVLNDLSNCKVAALSGVMTFKKIMDYLVSNGVGQVVRIVNKESVVLRQLLNLSAKMQRYKAIYVATLDEAEATLETLAQRDGLRFSLRQQAVDFWVNEVKGNGTLQDISTSGCAIDAETAAPAVGDRIQVALVFAAADKLLTEFNSAARVVRATGASFAVKFEAIDSELHQRLWERLVHESRRDLA